MSYFPRKMPPEILKMYSLAGRLSPEDQLEFLRLLSSRKDQADKKELIVRASEGESVWEKKRAE